MNTDAALPLTTETGIRAALEREAAEVFEDAKGGDLDLLDEQVGFALEGFEKALVGRALWRLTPGVRALHARCAAEGRTSLAKAVVLGNGARAFLVPTASATTILLAVQHGENRFVTGVNQAADPRGHDRTNVLVGRWKPDAADFLATLPDPLPEDLGEAVRLATEAAKYADIGSGCSLEAIGRFVAETRADRLPYGCNLTGASFTALDGTRVPTLIYSANRVALCFWVPYTKAMAPVATLGELPDLKLISGNGADDVAVATLALDGGFFGPKSAALTHANRGFMLLNHLSAAVDTFRQNHDDLVQLGAVWGQQSLVHGDLDMRSFAVPLEDPAKRAFVHHSINANGPTARYLVLLTVGNGDTVTGLEVHPLYKPIERQRENWDCRHGTDSLMLLADRVIELADPEASPPRLSQVEFIRRLQAGEPLPPPALAADLANGQTAIPTRIGEGIGFHWMVDLIGATRKALDQALSEDKKGNSALEFRREFGDEEYGEHAPGMEPRRKR